MSLTGIIANGFDIATLFAPGSSSFSTGYLTNTGVDIATLFAPGSSSFSTGYLTNTGVDIATLFAPSPNSSFYITGTGTYTTTYIGTYTVISFLSGNCDITIYNTNQINYLCVAGGGAGGCAGGGGAGGYLEGSISTTNYFYTKISVGEGGQGYSTIKIPTLVDQSMDQNSVNLIVANCTGKNSTISNPSITSNGGGRGGWATNNTPVALNSSINGGSGGGGCLPLIRTVATNFGYGTPGQGNNGGRAIYTVSGNNKFCNGGAGGGAGECPPNATKVNAIKGGNGKICYLSGITLMYPGIYWGGGGGGESYNGLGGNGGLGGGGGGRSNPTQSTGGVGGLGGINPGGTTTYGYWHIAGDGGKNTGSGGGGGSHIDTYEYTGGQGGSGIIIFAFLT